MTGSACPGEGGEHSYGGSGGDLQCKKSQWGDHPSFGDEGNLKTGKKPNFSGGSGTLRALGMKKRRGRRVARSHKSFPAKTRGRRLVAEREGEFWREDPSRLGGFKGFVILKYVKAWGASNLRKKYSWGTIRRKREITPRKPFNRKWGFFSIGDFSSAIRKNTRRGH